MRITLPLIEIDGHALFIFSVKISRQLRSLENRFRYRRPNDHNIHIRSDRKV